MNKQIDQLTKELWELSTKSFKELEHIRRTLFNIKVSVSKLNHSETRALDTIATYIENAIVKLETGTYRIKEISKEIGNINKNN